MFARKGAFSPAGRPVVMAAVAALTLTAIAPNMALAGSAPQGLSAIPAHGITDVSSRRRVYRGNGGAVAAAAFAGIVGTGLAIAATQNRRDYYDSYGYYGGGPVYYGGSRSYYRGYGGDASTQPYVDQNGGW